MAWLPSTRRFSAEEYLARYKLRAFLVELVTELLQSRPAVPVDFVCNYLVTQQRTISPLTDAYRAVRLCAACSFHRHLFAAFNFAVAHPGSHKTFPRSMPLIETVGDGDVRGGLAKRAYYNLVRLLCADLPGAAAVRLLALLCRSGGEVAMRAGLDKWDVVSFDQFCSGMWTLMSCESFMRESNDLFRCALSHSSSADTAPTTIGVFRHLIALHGVLCTGTPWDNVRPRSFGREAFVGPCKLITNATLAGKVAFVLFREKPNSPLVFVPFENTAVYILFATALPSD